MSCSGRGKMSHRPCEYLAAFAAGRFMQALLWKRETAIPMQRYKIWSGFASLCLFFSSITKPNDYSVTTQHPLYERLPRWVTTQYPTGTQASHLRQPAGETPAYQSEMGNYRVCNIEAPLWACVATSLLNDSKNRLEF